MRNETIENVLYHLKWCNEYITKSVIAGEVAKNEKMIIESAAFLDTISSAVYDFEQIKSKYLSGV